jgi:hypothetical protein
VVLAGSDRQQSRLRFRGLTGLHHLFAHMAPVVPVGSDSRKIVYEAPGLIRVLHGSSCVSAPNALQGSALGFRIQQQESVRASSAVHDMSTKDAQKAGADAHSAMAGETASVAMPGRCASDDACTDGFCDSDGNCKSVDAASGLGTPCKLPPDELPAETKAELRTCSAYRCNEGRCRSCTSDADCQGDVDPNLIHITCAEVAGLPGKRCGDYSTGR